MADISFCVALTAYDIKLSGDHGAGLAPDGILDVIHGSDQDLSCWNPVSYTHLTLPTNSRV